MPRYTGGGKHCQVPLFEDRQKYLPFTSSRSMTLAAQRARPSCFLMA